MRLCSLKKLGVQCGAVECVEVRCVVRCDLSVRPQ